jgi:tetratricopeptide (TPR) repeat protein
MELENELYEKITALSEKGDMLVEREKYDKAIENYIQGLDLLPSPKDQWEAATWLYTAIGDTYFIMERYDLARDRLLDALNCPDAMENAFIYLRLGQACYELGTLKQAEEYLLRAYMLHGEDIFASEEEKYYLLIKPLI